MRGAAQLTWADKDGADEPEKTKKGKRPKFHAASEEQWLIYVKNWELWLTRYEDASKRLEKGIVGGGPSRLATPSRSA